MLSEKLLLMLREYFKIYNQRIICLKGKAEMIYTHVSNKHLSKIQSPLDKLL